MTKFEKATVSKKEIAETAFAWLKLWHAGDKNTLAVTGPNLTASQALKALIEFLEHSLHGQVYLNDTYQVIRNEIDNGMVHLSIRRLDRSHEHDWREYQEIKNQLLGEECEAFEIYPAESRCVDLANQFHGPATIVWWTKASKTVVKLAKGDKHDPVKAFLIAFFLFRSGMTRTAASKLFDRIRQEAKDQLS